MLRNEVDPYQVQLDPVSQQVAQQLGGQVSGGGWAVPQPPPPSPQDVYQQVRTPYGPPASGTMPNGPGVNLQAPTAPAYDTSKWNTDQYAAPQYVAPNPGQVMAGWDATKWADQNHQTPKYAVGRILSQYSPTVQGLADALPELQKAFPGVTFDGKDKITIPGLGTIDVLAGASQGGTGWAWQDLAAMAREQQASQQALQNATPGAGVPNMGAGGFRLGDPNQFNSVLAQLLGQDPNGISRNDADIRPAAQAHDAALQRARRMRQSAMAERAMAEGTSDSGAFDADVASSYEDMGRAQGAYEGQLINQKAQERRQQIMQALQLGGGLMDSQMRMALTKELQQLDDTTRRYGLDLQNRQYYDRLGFDQASFEGVMNQNLVNNLLGF